MIKHSPPVLIFPASYYQMDLFQAARDLGYRIATFDYAADNPGHQIADVSSIIDVRDLDGTLQFAQSQNILAVGSACSDVSLAALAHISHHMGFPGPSPDLVETVTSKINFRRWQYKFASSKLPFIALEQSRITQELRDDLPERVVVKPDVASGSKGIYTCSADEVTDALLASSARESLNGCVLIEQWISGDHYTFEGFLHEGAFVFQMCTSRLRNPEDQIGTVGHIFPSGLSEDLQEQIMIELKKVFEHFGYQNGPVDCDFVVSGAQVFILEMTPRLGGNAISKLVQASYGFSLPEYYLRHQLGLNVDWPDVSAGKPAAVYLIVSEADGVLHYDAEELELLPDWVYKVDMDYAPNTPVRKFRDGRDRIGEVTLLGQTAQSVHSRFDVVLKQINFRIEPS